MFGLDMRSRERYALNPYVGKDSFRSEKACKEMALAIVILARNDFQWFMEIMENAVSNQPDIAAEIDEFVAEIKSRLNDDDLKDLVYRRLYRAMKEEARLCF